MNNLQDTIMNYMSTAPYILKLYYDFGFIIAGYGFVSIPAQIDAIIKVNTEGDKVEIKMTHFLIQEKADLKYTSDIDINSDFLTNLKDELEALAFEKSLIEEESAKTNLHRLYTSLIGGEIREFLEKNYKKIKTIWIDCNIEEINPFWELLYVNLGPDKSFFWGDQFAIARVPTSYKSGKKARSEKKMSGWEIFKVFNELTIKLTQHSPQSIAEVEIKVNGKVKVGLIKLGESQSMKDEKKYFNENNGFEVIEVIESASDISKIDGKVFDILHFIAHHEEGNLESHVDIIDFKDLNMRTPDCIHVVFFNACRSEVEVTPTGDCGGQKLAHQDCFRNKKAWIGTHLKVGEETARNFVENFYNQFLLGESIAKSAKEARKNNNNIMRLFYTVYGWPFTRLV
ncbi:hypothetical protein C5S29_06405 [ANME-1 cluster archaeon GoMg3.2]|nr:hypothetical protein [ANME-1 cluster archaeon GoMg3.2]